MKQRISVLCLAGTLGVAALGCGAQADQDETVDQGSSEIYGGTTGGGSGSVDIVIEGGERCTGVLVGQRMVLTASQCFDAAMRTATTKLVSVRIALSYPDGRWKCIHEPLNGSRCTQATQVRVYRLVAPSGGIASQYTWNLAAVFMGEPGARWPNVTPTDGAYGFYDDALAVGTTYRFFGRGFSAPYGDDYGPMKFMDDALDWVGANHFTTTANNARICVGDQGGPYFRSGTRWLFGLGWVGTSAFFGACPNAGATMVGTRINAGKRDIIQDWRSQQAHQICEVTTTPNHWSCP